GAARPRAAFSADKIGEVEAGKVHRLLPCAARGARSGFGVAVISLAVVHLAFFCIAQDVVSFRDFLEALFRALVAGIYVRMIFTGKPLVGLAYFISAGFPVDTQPVIEIVFACHVYSKESEARSQKSEEHITLTTRVRPFRVFILTPVS